MGFNFSSEDSRLVYLYKRKQNIVAGTMRPLPTEPLPIPPLCLSGRLPQQQNAIVNLDLTQSQAPPGGGAAADITAWPEFHNGVAAGACCHDPDLLFSLAIKGDDSSISRTADVKHAASVAGLRMAPGCAHMTRTWIRYNKPKVASYTHAGMIMGLGLTGELASSPLIAPTHSPLNCAARESLSGLRLLSFVGAECDMTGACYVCPN